MKDAEHPAASLYVDGQIPPSPTEFYDVVTSKDVALGTAAANACSNATWRRLITNSAVRSFGFPTSPGIDFATRRLSTL